MKITVLIENTAYSDLIAEHGLSLLIEYNDKTYLLDAGQTSEFIHNANTLNICLDNVKLAVLSHGHYDHAGGFLEFLSKYPKIKLYAMEDAKNDYYSSSGGIHPIGVPSAILTQHKYNFMFVNCVTQLDDGVYIVPHTTKGLDAIGERAGLYKMVDDKLVPDDFSHELSLVFETEKGLVIFNSCSHAGVCNIITEVKNAFPQKHIYAFVGGLHMKGTKNGEECCTFSESELSEIAKTLKVEKLQKLYTGHCTGKVGFNLLKKYMGESLQALYTGKIIDILE